MWRKLRCQDGNIRKICGIGLSHQIHWYPCHLDTWGYSKLIKHIRVVDSSMGPYWTRIDWKMAPKTCTIQWWPKKITKSFYPFRPTLYFKDFLLKGRTRFETLYILDQNFSFQRSMWMTLRPLADNFNVMNNILHKSHHFSNFGFTNIVSDMCSFWSMPFWIWKYWCKETHFNSS